jgi:nucleoside-diphosphate-sugar epimerase
MIVLVAGAHGRLGQRLVALLRTNGHVVRALVRSEEQAAALRDIGAEAIVADLRGDVEWAAEGCDATIVAAGARHRAELGAVDAGGAAKLAEAAARYEQTRFVLCSIIGAGHAERADGALGEFLAAKHHAEQRTAELDLPWTILRFGELTERSGTGRIETTPGAGAKLTLSRDDAALTIAGTLSRPHLAHQVVTVIDGDRTVADALDAIAPRPLPATPAEPTGAVASLGAAQSDNPPDAPDMIAPDALPLDSDVDWEGDGPSPAEPVDNEDPSPGVP